MSNYVTTFEVFDQENESNRVGLELLEAAKGVIEEDLRATADPSGQDDWVVEFRTSDQAGYVEINAERPYSPVPEHLVRLEVRMYTKGEGVRAEVRSRFMLTSEGEPPNLRSGPPRLLRRMTEAFHCIVGEDEMSYQPLEIRKDNAEEYVTEVLTSERRSLPILAISQDGYGRFAISPRSAQSMLAGVAKVVAYELEGIEALKGRLNKNKVLCNGGAVRILWPGCTVDANEAGPDLHWARSVVRQMREHLLFDVQQECMDRVAETDFGREYWEIKRDIGRDLEWRMKLKEEEDEVRKLKFSAQQLKNQLEKKNEALNEKTAALEEERGKTTYAIEQVQELRRALEVLENEPEELRKRNRRRNIEELKKENKKLGDTRDKLNADNQALRQQNRVLEEQVSVVRGNGEAILELKSSRTGNLTVLNHAVNLFRGPMRSYLASRLSTEDLKYIKEEVGSNQILREEDPRTFEEFLDITEGEDRHGTKIMRFEDTAERFLQEGELAADLRHIRRMRNEGAHPPVKGLEAKNVKDCVLLISKVLDSVRESGIAMEVKLLEGLVRDNP